MLIMSKGLYRMVLVENGVHSDGMVSHLINRIIVESDFVGRLSIDQ
jgi:hypothetical protein